MTDRSNQQPPGHIVWSSGRVNRTDRERLLGQQGCVVWFTGLSGSGKSAIAIAVEQALAESGKLVYRLDGDNLRHGLNRDLGFSPEDRKENIRRVAEVAALLADAGIITLVSFISPYRDMRDFARERAGDCFFEVYVKASLETCRARDPKGLYKKADDGEIQLFTGVSAPYEAPVRPDLVLDTETCSIADAVKQIVELIF